MQRLVSAAVLAGLIVLVGERAPGFAKMEQDVEVMAPGVEQDVEVLGGQPRDQRVEVVDARDTQQAVVPEDPSPAKSTALGVAKVGVAVMAVVISLGAMAASLLLI